MTTLKNQHSTSRNAFEVIQKTLASHKAQRITLDYEDGLVKAIEFSLNINGVLCSFRLPARVENVERILYPSRDPYTLSITQKEQAYRTAWANVRDWITAQCAMIDTGMVKPEEVFLPYMLTPGGQTFFHALQEQHFLLLPPAHEPTTRMDYRIEEVQP